MDKQIPYVSDIKFTDQETHYFKTNNEYFKELNINDIQKMFDIIIGKSKISLRLLDWFTTKYVKKNGELCNIDISYEAQLELFDKKYFDPFKRIGKFTYIYSKDGYERKICTSIGQLNFFKWAFNNDVIKYVEENYNSLQTQFITNTINEKIY